MGLHISSLPGAPTDNFSYLLENESGENKNFSVEEVRKEIQC